MAAPDILLPVLVVFLLYLTRQHRIRQQRLWNIQYLRSLLENERMNIHKRRRKRMIRMSRLLLLTASRHVERSALSWRRIWVKDKSKDFFERIVCCWSDDDFKDNLQLSRVTFVYLCSKLAPRLQKLHCVREPLSVELRVAVTLWRLGTNAEYRSIGHLFGVGLSTVFVAVREVCVAIVELLLPLYIRVPNRRLPS